MVSAENRKPAPSVRAGTECRRGATIGAANGLILAAIGGAAPHIALAAAAGAGVVGALIALLVWSGSADVAEDPVLPPRDNR